jgi:hypothetical protein
MSAPATPKIRVFIDADVLFASAASPSENSAGLVLLKMAEITLIEAIASEQVLIEVERNIIEKIPKAIPAFRMLANRCLRIVPDPTLDEVRALSGSADPKDLPILTAAAREKCTFLATFNVRHFQPGIRNIIVLKPGDLVLRIRYLLSRLKTDGED